MKHIIAAALIAGSIGAQPDEVVFTSGGTESVALAIWGGVRPVRETVATPSGTAAATRKRLAELKEAGLSRIAVSLDGPDPATHDAFRRVRGSYAWTMRIISS